MAGVTPNRVFAQNLDRLLALNGLGRKKAAEAIGVPYKWLRRAVSHGLARPDPRNVVRLQMVTEFFALRRIDDLWRPSLVELRLAPDRRDEANGNDRTQRSAALDKLSDLLASGEHDYLYELIDDLHRKAIPEKARVEAEPTDDEVHRKTNLHNFLIKWTGSKRRQAKQIVVHFPRKIATYYEPFLGGGSILYELLGTDIEFGRIECSDTCAPLMTLWTVVSDDPRGLIRSYREMWGKLQEKGESYYFKVRDDFNRRQDPYLFFFLLRTCRTGLVRFNRAGEFNIGYHHARPGMSPERVESLVDNWRRRLDGKNVHFITRDYREVRSKTGDLLYLDPPYQNQTNRYYSGMIDFAGFFEWLRDQRGDHLLSLNGFVGGEDRTIPVPEDLYDEHIQIGNGGNLFDRLDGRATRAVTESLYIRDRRPVDGRRRPPYLHTSS
jgi:DNA adenine methylase